MGRFRVVKNFLFLILFLPVLVMGVDEIVEEKIITLALKNIKQDSQKDSDIAVNKYAPFIYNDKNEKVKTYVGCTPLAIARMMNHYKHPTNNSFVYDNSYVNLEADNMTDDFAKLVRDIGIYGDATYKIGATSFYAEKETMDVFKAAGYNIKLLGTYSNSRKDASKIYIQVKQEIDEGRLVLFNYNYDKENTVTKKIERPGHSMIVYGYKKVDPEGTGKEDLYLHIAFGQGTSNKLNKNYPYYDFNEFQLDYYDNPDNYSLIDKIEIFLNIKDVTPGKRKNISYSLFGGIEVDTTLDTNTDYCPGTRAEAYDDGGGLLMHSWDENHKDIKLQNCKSSDNKASAVFANGVNLKYGFWKTYKTNNLGVNFLGKPLSNERKDLLSTTCQNFEKGVLLYSKGRKILGSSTRFEPIWILYNNKMKNENITCGNFKDYNNIKTIKNCFPDIFDLKDDKYAHAICSIRRRGIINGFPSGKYKPNDPVTRSQLMKIVLLSKYDKYDIDKKIFPEGKELVDYIEYTDMDGNWAYDYVYYGTRLNIIHGHDKKFNPENPIVFQDACKIIVNTLFEKIESKGDDWYKLFITYLEDKGLEKDKFKIDQPMNRGDIAYIIAKVKGWI